MIRKWASHSSDWEVGGFAPVIGNWADNSADMCSSYSLS